MNTTSIVTLSLLFSAVGVSAAAQTSKTRAQVKSELAEAVRTVDFPSPGLNEQRRPRSPI